MPHHQLSAKGETFDKVLGLELGADDYVVKPFETKEIVARIKAVMRRTGKSSSENDIKEVSYDKLVVNMTKYELKVDGKVVDTPPKELELLYHLASNPNRVYTRDQLSDTWNLKTVWGVGYKFAVKEYAHRKGGSFPWRAAAFSVTLEKLGGTICRKICLPNILPSA